MPNPYILLGVLVAWIASLASVGMWQHRAGAVSERVIWQDRMQQASDKASAELKSVEDHYRQIERTMAGRLGDISTQYEKELSDASAQHAADLSALRTGNLRLRDPGAHPQACGSGLPPAASGAGRRDGPPASGLQEQSAGVLSDVASEFLLELVDRADSVAHQLAACQAVIRADRAEP